MSRPNDEGSTVAAATPQEQSTNDNAIVSPRDGERKMLATLQAQAALRGVRAERLAGRGRWVYVVIRGGRAIDCCDLDAARLAVQRLGGRA